MQNLDQYLEILSKEVELIQWEINGIKESLLRNRVIAAISLFGYIFIMILFSLFFLSYIVRVTSYTHFPTFILTLMFISLLSVSIGLLISGITSRDYVESKFISVQSSETVDNQQSPEKYYLKNMSLLRNSREQLFNENNKLMKKIKNSLVLSGSATIVYSISLFFMFF